MKSLDFVKKGKKSLMMPDIDSDIYTKVVDLEKSFIFYIYIVYPLKQEIVKKSKKQSYEFQH